MRWSRGRLFGEFDLRLNLADADHDLAAQFAGDGITPAMLGDEAFHRFLEAELPQTRAAFVKMLADGLTVVRGNLTIEIPIDTVKYVAAPYFVRVSAAHAMSSSA
jgi:hypothetical protein